MDGFEKENLQIGKGVWYVPRGNAALHWDGNPLKGTVSKIGRKYFYVIPDNCYYSLRFEIGTGLFSSETEDCNSSFDLYDSLAAAEETLKVKAEQDAIFRFFSDWSNRQTLTNSLTHKIYTLLFGADTDGKEHPDGAE